MPTTWTSRTRTRQPSGPVGINWVSPLARGLRILDYGLLDNRAADSRLQSVTADGATRAGTSGGVARRGALGKLFTQFDLSTTGAATFFSVSRFVSAEANVQSVILKAGGGSGMTGLGIHGGSDKWRQYRAAGNATSFSADVVVGAASLYEFAAQAITIDSTGNVVAYLDGAVVATGSITGGLVTRMDLPFSTMRDGYTGSGALSVSVDLLIGTVHDRAMPPEEVREFTRNPWQLFAPERKPVFYSLAGGVYSVSLSESATASDAMAASGALAAALAEAATASNTITAAAVFASALVEAVTASEANSATTTRAGALAESVTASDAMSATATLAGALAEAASASDAVSSIATMAAALSEAVSASDSIDGSVGAATYSATLTEAASASDSFSAAAVIAGAIVEAVTAGDTVAAIATFAAAITEAASASDAVSGARVMAAAISEAATASDAWTGTTGAAVLTASLAEAVTAGDVFTALDILARMGVRGAAGVARQAHMRHAQIQAARRRN